ncbi:hypothetical protein PVAG01_07595 [Phlyctema vagabunda]|uniref:Uncharacterized protein n=1 Tax=Phlyctema vagabunda TaxID=108571 RepID=A0ABR4PCV9_9HELO
MVVQIIPSLYIDEQLLRDLMLRNFGRNSYRIMFKAGQWTIQAPRLLTDAELESVEQPGQH